jgi:hypothetical protein
MPNPAILCSVEEIAEALERKALDILQNKNALEDEIRSAKVFAQVAQELRKVKEKPKLPVGAAPVQPPVTPVAPSPSPLVPKTPGPGQAPPFTFPPFPFVPKIPDSGRIPLIPPVTPYSPYVWPRRGDKIGYDWGGAWAGVKGETPDRKGKSFCWTSSGLP